MALDLAVLLSLSGLLVGFDFCEGNWRWIRDPTPPGTCRNLCVFEGEACLLHPW